MLISKEQMLLSAELIGCVTWLIYVLDFPQVRCNCAKFHHCRICVTDFGKWNLFDPASSVSSPKKAQKSPNRVKPALDFWIHCFIADSYCITVFCSLQKQPPEMFYKRAVLKNFAKFKCKHLSWSPLFDKGSRFNMQPY